MIFPVTSIGELAFNYCMSLKSVTIGNSVTSIGTHAFRECIGLTAVHISDVTAWCNITFNNTNSNPLFYAKHLYLNGEEIKDLIIPNSVTSIGSLAFWGCSGLTSVTISNSMTSIGNSVFWNCSGLTNVTIPNSVTSIDYGAFAGCSRLTNISIPNSVTSIGSYAFSDCTGLTSVTIPNSVTSIEGGAFSGCSSLTSITIGNSIKTISGKSFAKCPELSDVYCYAETVPSTDATAFDDSFIESATLHVPESAIEDYSAASPWNLFENIVALAALPKYNLTYTIDGETYKTYAYLEGKSVPAEAAPEKEGYTFSGWSEIPETMPAHDVEVTGSFTVNTYKLTYMVDGVEYKTVDVEYGTAIVPEEAPKKTGYTFQSWSGLPETMPASEVTVTATYEKTILGKCLTPTIAFKDGKFKFESEEEGVEFVWSISIANNSGKGNEAGRPQKYTVSVYATKEFYEDSDTATMEMDMSSPIGDVNGDGIVDATDIAFLVNILLHL